MVKLKESPELLVFNARAVPDGFEKVKIVRMRGKTLRFHGRQIGEQVVGSRNNPDRWLELRLWETPAGAWVVAMVRASDVRTAGREERDIEDALVIPPNQVNIDGPTMAMDFWNWITPARSLSRELGWRFEEFVE
jgi:hypothetical protein